MVAALGGAFYGTLQQAITPIDFMWSTSLGLLLLVVLGGRSVISGAVIAGAVYAVREILPATVNQYIPLAIRHRGHRPGSGARGRRGPGRRQTRHVLAVLKPLPRRGGPAEVDMAPVASAAPAQPRVPVAAGAANGGVGHGH